MRILMLCRQFYPWVGGTERQAQRLAGELINQGVDVQVVTGWWFRGTPRQERVAGVPVQRLFTCWQMFNIRGLRKFSAYLYMLALLGYMWRHRHQYDVIHMHMINYDAVVGVVVGKWLGKKTLVKVAASGPDGDLQCMRENRYIPGTRRMLPYVCGVNCVVSLNQESTRELLEAGFAPEQIVSIPNGIDVRHMPSKPDYALGEEVRILFVGRLHPQKNVDQLLRALVLLIEWRTDIAWRLELLGEGWLQPKLEALAQQLGIAPHTTFWGKVDNVLDHMVQSDIFVLPSRSEGISNALLEAMACGLPCVATDIPGNNLLIEHEMTGLLVPVDAPQTLANAIARLQASHLLRESLGKAAAARIREQFAIQRVAQQYVSLYQRLLNEEDLVELSAVERTGVATINMPGRRV